MFCHIVWSRIVTVDRKEARWWSRYATQNMRGRCRVDGGKASQGNDRAEHEGVQETLRVQQRTRASGGIGSMLQHDTSCGAGQDVSDGVNVSASSGCTWSQPGRVHREGGSGWT